MNSFCSAKLTNQMYFSTSISLCVCITLFIALIVKSHACNSYFIFYQVASMEKVSAVIALGYPMWGLNGLRGVCCQISQIVVNDVWFIDSGAHKHPIRMWPYNCSDIYDAIYNSDNVYVLLSEVCMPSYQVFLQGTMMMKEKAHKSYRYVCHYAYTFFHPHSSRSQMMS